MLPFLKLLAESVRLVAYSLLGLVVATIIGLVLYFSAALVRGHYLPSPESFSEADIDRLESNLQDDLSHDRYGLINHSMWTNLFAQTFYVYGRANRYEKSPTEAKKQALVSELERVYRWIDQTERAKFAGVGETELEYGIIYNGHRLHVLALLAKYRGDEVTRNELNADVKALVAILEKSPRYTAESYPGWAWWVDNLDAYYALYLTDQLNGTHEYRDLTAKWTAEIRKSLDANGNILAEAFGPYMSENQARSGASIWMLIYLRDLDPALYQQQRAIFAENFEMEIFGLHVLSEVPKGQERINSVPTGPVIFGASSAGTILSLPYYRRDEPEKAGDILHAIETLFWYDRENGSLLGGISTMLESTVYWGMG